MGIKQAMVVETDRSDYGTLITTTTAEHINKYLTAQCMNMHQIKHKGVK
jgi:hypothetical protein